MARRTPEPSPALLLGRSKAAARARRLVELYAPTEETILLTGETGTGKTVLAESLHRMSQRRDGPFCVFSLAESAGETDYSRLFGHVRGSYTGAETQRAGMLCSANRGTLFLDELGKASLADQSRLLNVIERRAFYPLGSDVQVTVSVRFVLAMSEDPERLVAEGRLLNDLWGRIRAFRIPLPPIRARRQDIPDLLAHFVARHAPGHGYAVPPTFEPELLEHLIRWDWPYNLRGLDDIAKVLLTHAKGAPVLRCAHAEGTFAERVVKPQPAVLDPYEDETIRKAVRQTGSIRAAARKLGIEARTVRAHLAKDSEGRALLEEIRSRRNTPRPPAARRSDDTAPETLGQRNSA